MTVLEFADRFLKPYKQKGVEIVPTECPFCHGGSKHDKDTFALNIENKTFNCKRGSCLRKGHFTQLCREFGVDVSDGPPLKKYKRPTKAPQPWTSEAEKYMAIRKISNVTAAAYRVGSDEKGNLMFPFYDEAGEHVFTKYRYARKLAPGDRKAWREADTKPILFGMHLCDPAKPLTITEGEFDAMSLHEVGIPNAVSVPSGAEDFTWLDTCWDFLLKFSEVYIFGDNDEAGRKMVEKLTVKLPCPRIFVVEHPEKDSNALLYRQGPEAVLEAWRNAREVPVSGLLNLADILPIDPTTMERTRTNFKGLDALLGGFLAGDVTVWTGKRGEGKSTVLSQVLLDAIEQGKKVCAYSGELRADRFQYWVDLQAAGPEHLEHVETASWSGYKISKTVREQIHAWYDGKFWLYDNGIALTDEEATVISVFEKAAKRYDCKVFLIDNLMTVDFGKIKETDYLLRQTQFVNQLAAFANLYNVHVHLVAHPRKGEINSADDISGSANVGNRVANVVAVARPKTQTEYTTTLEVLKNRWEGRFGTVGLCFEESCKRAFDPQVPTVQYGWEKDNFVEIQETEDLPF